MKDYRRGLRTKVPVGEEVRYPAADPFLYRPRLVPFSSAWRHQCMLSEPGPGWCQCQVLYIGFLV